MLRRFVAAVWRLPEEGTHAFQFEILCSRHMRPSRTSVDHPMGAGLGTTDPTDENSTVLGSSRDKDTTFRPFPFPRSAASLIWDF